MAGIGFPPALSAHGWRGELILVRAEHVPSILVLAERGAYGHLSIAPGIVGKPDAGQELVPVVAVGALAACVSGISRKDVAVRRIHKYFAWDTGIEVGGIEMNPLAVCVVDRRVRLP